MKCLFRTLLKPAALALLAVALAAVPSPSAAVAQGAKAPEELRLLHVLLVVDTNTNLSSMVKVDLQNIKCRLEGGIPKERLDMTILQGDDVTPENVVKYYRNLAVKPDEGLLFFYSGHAGIDERFGQVFTMGAATDKYLARSQLVEEMTKKNAGVTILLTNCCSSMATIPVQPVLAAGKPSPKDLDPLLKQLFFQHRGVVDITAAERGDYAWLDDKVGGIFTFALWSLLQKQVADLDTDGDGFVTWDEFYKQLREETNKVFLARKAEWPNRSEIQQQQQYAFAYAIPQPGGTPLLKPTVRTGYKLGARVTPHPMGVKILAITPGGPAARLGLEMGDIIVKVNGLPARSLDEYSRLLDSSPMGKATLDFIDGRTGKPVKRDLVLDPIK